MDIEGFNPSVNSVSSGRPSVMVTTAVLVALLASIASASKCPNSDLSWFRQNARTLLFLEHLQNRATTENLFDWSNQLGSDTYRAKLRDLENEFLAPEEVPEECYDKMPIPPVLAQRISFLEDRLEGCSGGGEGHLGGQPCDGGGENYVLARRVASLQAELMRQRTVLRSVRLRLSTINRQCEGTETWKKKSFIHSSILINSKKS